MLNAISPTILIAIGILLIAAEAATFTFVLFWFGIASIIVGIISYIVSFSDGAWQIAFIGIIAIALLFFLRTKTLDTFLKSKDGEIKDDFLNTKGVGTVKNGKIYYKATFWDCDDIDSFKDGEKVEVLEAKKNMVKIKRKEKYA